MSRRTFTFLLEVEKDGKVQATIRDPDGKLLGQPRGEFGFRQVIPPEIWELHQQAYRRQISDEQVARLGEALFGALFDQGPQPLRSEFLRLLNDQVIPARETVLRFVIDVDESSLPAVASLPWEFMRVPDNANLGMLWLATHPRIILSRQRKRWFAPKPIQLTDHDRLKVLVAVAEPTAPGPDGVRLGAVKFEDILDTLQTLTTRLGSRIELLAPVHPATFKAVEDALHQGQPHIFHFIGHARLKDEQQREVGQVALVDNMQGAPEWTDARVFSDLFNQHAPSLVMLQACESAAGSPSEAFVGVASQIMEKNLPIVLAMQYEVTNATARTFTLEFYERLSRGEPVDKAAQEARRRIVLQRIRYSRPDFATPVLFMNVEDGNFFPERTRTLAWQNVLDYSRQQTDRFLRELLSTADRLRTFIPTVYVNRHAESDLQAFLESESAGLILLGDSGSGKTNMLCHWTLVLQAAGHGVFFYDCSGSLRSELDAELAQDLSLDDPQELWTILEEVSGLAEQQGRCFVLIFDAINQFRGRDSTGPETILKLLDSMVGRLSSRHLKIVMSCSLPMWRQLERAEVTQLFWSRYYRPGGGEPFLQLGTLTTDEFEAAYPHYQEFFHLHTPLGELSPELRERLRMPLLLRMVAEAYKDRTEPIADEELALGIFARYYNERVKRRADQFFLEHLATEMLRQCQSVLQVQELVQNELLRTAVLDDSADSSYYRMLDAGVLSETSEDVWNNSLVRFSYSRVGAYVLANYLRSQPGEILEKLEMLTRLSKEFSLAWDAALMLLLQQNELKTFVSLAQSAELVLRELAVEGLVELHQDHPAKATNLIEALLQTSSEEAHRTGLKAAYYIGLSARSIFLWAAVKGSPALRRATKDTLYLIWRTRAFQAQNAGRQETPAGQSEPDFVFELMRELSGRIGLSSLGELPNALEFIIDLSITIYINHCDEPGIVQRMSDLWYEVLVNRLHMDLLNTGILGPGFEKLIIEIVARAFTGRLLDTLLFTELVPAERFFNLTAAEKERFRRVALLSDPSTDLVSAADDLAYLFNSDIVLFNIVAALVVAIHAFVQFELNRVFLTEILEKLEARGLLWLLLAFAVLIRATPSAWVEWTESITRQLIERYPEIFYNTQTGALVGFDIALLPLGLAYGKRGLAMPYFESNIREGLEQGDLQKVARWIVGLGPVGFYYPQAVFHTLRATITDFTLPELQTALINSLAITRTLHFDAVDIFLRQINASEAMRRQVAAASDIELVRRYVYWLGIYNNAVHQALYYPRMRQHLLIGGLLALAEAHQAKDFIASYTLVPIRMVRESGYRLDAWTLPG